ncbi:MAG TPA: hypothetical protein VJY62_02570 [Bacteroidia bacterium]|nr:hypothetical protein [Bacteroidia bacterium]
MKKSNKKSKTEQEPMNLPTDFEVKGASIADDLCNYSIHVTSGAGVGKHNVKGEGIVDEDMKIAFSRFNVHLAIIDGVYKHKGIEIDKINKFHNHDITNDYTVSGFKMNGEEDNLSIVLIGSKHVANGIMDMETPKIMLDHTGGYEFFKELKAASENAIKEVELYIGGKCTMPEEDEGTNPNQVTLHDAIEEAEKEKEFSSGKV